MNTTGKNIAKLIELKSIIIVLDRGRFIELLAVTNLWQITTFRLYHTIFFKIKFF